MYEQNGQKIEYMCAGADKSLSRSHPFINVSTFFTVLTFLDVTDKPIHAFH